MVVGLTLLACIFTVFGGLILFTHDTDKESLIGSGFIILALLCFASADNLKRKTPEYKLWEKRQELEEKKRAMHRDSIEKQKQIWIWKRHKELEDSLKLLK
jgi:hypothetical protein